MSAVDADEALKEIVELARLYDVYGPMLSEHKKEIFESYVLDNLSLSEIAEDVGISRQGVRDLVRRCSRELQEYEEKLHFVEKLGRISECIDESIDIVLNLISEYQEAAEKYFDEKSLRRLLSRMKEAESHMQDMGGSDSAD